MYPVVHFEMAAEDRKRMSGFYEKAFGWECDQLGPEMDDYVMVMTTESDKKGPLKKGIINGGFYQKMEDEKMNYPSVVISVDDIKEQMKIVEKEGGKILGEAMEIPEVGLYVSFLDTEGNRVSMLQPSEKM